MKIKFQGELCMASGENWNYKRSGRLSVFEQTGKIPSLRVVKHLLKLHIKMNNIGAQLTCNNLYSCSNTPNDRSQLIPDIDLEKGGAIKADGLRPINEC